MYKQAIVVRSDLRMSKGKTAVQVAHASVSAVMKAKKTALNSWGRSSQKKVVLKADLKGIRAIEEKCRKSKISFSLIMDAGLTELRSGTVTAIALGPDEEKRINKITGSLPLLK